MGCDRATELIEIAAQYGATGLCLCGCVARGIDTDQSNLDFYVQSFTREPGAGVFDARGRADALVKAFPELLPFKVDLRPLPDWLLGSEEERSMRADAIELTRLVP